jgi:hypothetical protein
VSWQDEVGIATSSSAAGAKRLVLGVLPDDSGNWSTIGAPFIILKVDDAEARAEMHELEDVQDRRDRLAYRTDS